MQLMRTTPTPSTEVPEELTPLCKHTESTLPKREDWSDIEPKLQTFIGIPNARRLRRSMNIRDRTKTV